MVLRLPDKWVWDFWFAQDGANYHIFYLQAPHSIGDESLRHWHTSIGHAVSQDLIHWRVLPDALAPSAEAAQWDNYTTWTGSIIQYDGTWYMFYTGSNREEDGKYQRIGLATSKDLIDWQKYAYNPIIEPDPRWYENYDPKIWFDQTWRDPWIFEHESTYHAYITGRAKNGEKNGRGVIAHAISSNLLNWEVQTTITQPGEFGYLEVPQLVEICERWYLLFSTTKNLYSKSRQSRPEIKPETGTHYFVADHPLGPFEFLTDEFLVGDEVGSLYSGKVIHNPEGELVFMAFRAYGKDSRFIGEIANPLPIAVLSDGRLKIN